MRYFILFFVILAFSACNPSKIAIEKIEATDFQGNKVNWEKYQGKVVFFHFWATWCRDCLVEMPKLIELAAQYQGNEKVVFVFASDESLERQQAFLAESPNLPFQFVKLSKSLKENGIIYIPQTYLFDKKGNLVQAARDKTDWTSEEQSKKMKALMEE
ncbi:MAG: TlpA family protein disulfide reductase [Bacteroidia bacterium]